jgi:hypothetical protein
MDFRTFDIEHAMAIVTAQKPTPRGPVNVNDLSSMFLDDGENFGQWNCGVIGPVDGGECFVDCIAGVLDLRHFGVLLIGQVDTIISYNMVKVKRFRLVLDEKTLIVF